MLSSVAIGVAAGLGTLILMFSLVRFIIWFRRRKPNHPLPPVQMLAHDRQRQRDTYLSQTNYADQLQALSPTIETPVPYKYGSASSSDVQSPTTARNSEDCISTSPSSSRAELVTSHNRQDNVASSRHLPTNSSIASSPSVIGAPHNRMDRFEIVLPPPLAGGLVGKRISVYDQWTPPLGRSSSKLRVSIDSGEIYLLRLPRAC